MKALITQKKEKINIKTQGKKQTWKRTGKYRNIFAFVYMYMETKNTKIYKLEN